MGRGLLNVSELCGTVQYVNTFGCSSSEGQEFLSFYGTPVHSSPPCVPLLNYSLKKYSRTVILLSSFVLIVSLHLFM